MVQFIFRRIGLVIPTFIGITLLTFALIRLIPGDPIEVMVGERGISAERHAQLQAELGLDKPLYSQYFDYVGNILQGDLGQSLRTKAPVLDEFLTLFPATVELALCAVLFAVVIGLPVGILAAVKRGSVFDHSVMAVSLTGYSMPIFWWALLLMLVFSVN
ncbi:MAG: ABC transporter permease subunit, partial [Plesiomonas sp.]